MEGQQFCLRWHNFQNTLLNSLPKLLNGGYLTDVTLSAGGKYIHAHRIILSACSYYFKNLFKDLNSFQHPVIILPGMEYSNLCALITFMYNGEVNIYQEQLPALLSLADMLHVRGLADIAGKASSSESNQSSDQYCQQSPEENNFHIDQKFLNINQQDSNDLLTQESHNTIEPMSADFHMLEHSIKVESDSNNKDIEVKDLSCNAVKTKPYYSINAKLLNQREKKTPGFKIQDNPIVQITPNIKEEVSHNPALPEMTFKNYLSNCSTTSTTSNTIATTSTANRSSSQPCNKSAVTCLICGKQLSNQYNLRVHMETHSNSSYSCTACSHVSRSRDALRKHVSYRHPTNTDQKRARFSTTKP